MQYISTRGTAPVLSFEEAMLTGLARDGGLYLPETVPQLSADEIGALLAFAVGNPAASIAALASILSPSNVITLAAGPMKVMPSSSSRFTKCAFSAKNP